MDGRQLNLKIALTLMLGTGALLYPKTTEKFRIINPKALQLKISKNSPPLAILEDEKLTFLEHSSNTEEKIILASGNNFDSQTLERIKVVEVSIKEPALQIHSETTQLRNLSGITLKKDSPNIQQLQRSLGQKTNNEVVLVKHSINENDEQIVIVEKKQDNFKAKVHFQEKLNLNDFVNLSPHLRNRLEDVAGLEEILNEDYSGDSFEDYARVAIEEIKQQEPDMLHAEDNRLIHTGALPRVDNRSNQERAEVLARNFSRNRIVQQAAAKPQPTVSKTTDTAGFLNNKDDVVNPQVLASRSTQGFSQQGLLNENINQAYFGGTIELQNGLALEENGQIVIYRKVAGNPISEGQFKINQGRYEIYVENPSTGTIVAELWNKDELVGKGEVLIPEILKNAKSRDELQSVNLQIKPIVKDVVVTALSGYSSEANKIYAKTSKAVINDVIYMGKKNSNTLRKSILSASSLVVKTEKDNHWGSICIGSSDQNYQPKLYHDNTIAALFGISNKKLDKEKLGVIWGNIKVHGKSVSGATVELISRETYQPIYFNSFLPDASLQATSTKGEFAYTGLEPGTYILKAKYKNKYLSPQVIEVQAGYVSEVEFDVEKPSLSEAFVFDIQTSEMLNAKLNFLGLDETYDIKGGRRLISFSGNKGLQFLEVIPTNDKYSSTRVTVNKSQKEILIPMIPEAWLTELFQRLKTNYVPNTALILGLSHSENSYTVEMDASGYNEDTRVLYFDKKGQWVQGATQTPQGGGFVISNVNAGVRSVFIKYANYKDLKVNTVIADSTAINVINPN